MKREEHARRGLPFDGEFYIWDYRYYDRQFVERELALDADEVKKYFPVDVVVPTILEIYQHLLGVQFVKLNVEAWHPGALLVAAPTDALMTVLLQRSNSSRYGTRIRRTQRTSSAIATLTCFRGVSRPLDRLQQF